MTQPECSILGCRSNTLYEKHIIYFAFPSRDSPMYNEWLSKCIESTELITSQSRPFVCSRHFHKKGIRGMHLVPGSVPTQLLNVANYHIEEERVRIADQAERIRIRKLVEETTFEWVKRAKTDAILGEICTYAVELQDIAKKARNLLGATLDFPVEGYWIKKFRRIYLDFLKESDMIGREDKSLDVKDIILELSPDEVILSKEEIEELLKEEKASTTEKQVQNRLARAKRREADYKDRCKNSCPAEFKVDSMDVSTGMGASFKECEKSSLGGEVVIESYEQALDHLKRLEEFALQEEDYSIIDALATVEMLLRYPEKSVDP